MISSQFSLLKTCWIMDRYLQTSDVIVELQSQSSITDLLTGGIHDAGDIDTTSWLAWPFLTIRNIDETGTYINSNPLFNFTFEAHNRTVTFDTLKNIANTVFAYIRSTNTYNSFQIYWTWPLRKFWDNEIKKLRYIQYDLRFYYTK